MILHIDPGSAVPPYEQIRTQVEAMVESGVLLPGRRLPAIRQLAGDLGLAGGTVARAYRELEAAGTVVARGRHGTVIADRSHAADAGRRTARLTAAAESFAATAHHTGTDLDHAVAELRQAFARLQRGDPPPPANGARP